MLEGSCLQTYIPIRSEPRPGAEMVSSLIFGESYTVLEQTEEWLHIRTHFDQYEGWISANTYNAPVDYTEVIDTDYVEAHIKGEKILIPCGGLIPENNRIQLQDKAFELKVNLKPSNHLPLRIRLTNSARSLLNAPYLWGGRTFMGIDCSGFVQVVYKANGISLPRDTRQQVSEGTDVAYNVLQTGDLVFFSKPGSEKVGHVGMMLSPKEIIHASGKVKIDQLTKDGIVSEGKLIYHTIALKRIVS